MTDVKFPILFISDADRASLTSKKNDFVESEESTGTISFLSSFLADFSVTSYSLKKAGLLFQLTVTVQKINGNSLMNTTFNVGTVASGYRPADTVSGTFPYGGGIAEVGQIHLGVDGSLSIRTGNNASFPNGTSGTFSLMFL